MLIKTTKAYMLDERQVAMAKNIIETANNKGLFEYDLQNNLINYLNSIRKLNDDIELTILNPFGSPAPIGLHWKIKPINKS